MVALMKVSRARVKRLHAGEKLDYREGEPIGLFDLRAFGDDRKAWIVALREIVAAGAGVVWIDRETGALGEECFEVKSAELYYRTLNANRRTRGLNDRRHAGVRDARMPADDAKMIWFDPELSRETAIERMTGWTKATAYVHFGSRTHGEHAKAMHDLVRAEKRRKRAASKQAKSK